MTKLVKSKKLVGGGKTGAKATDYPKYVKQKRKHRRYVSETERRIAVVGKDSKKLCARWNVLRGYRRQARERYSDVGKLHGDEVDSLRAQLDINRETLEFLRKKENIRRELGVEGYENSRLEPTKEALWFRKMMRREYGKGLSFDIDGSLVKINFNPQDYSGNDNRVIVGLAENLNAIGEGTPWPSNHPGEQMKMFIQEGETHSTATFEVGHLDTEIDVHVFEEGHVFEW